MTNDDTAAQPYTPSIKEREQAGRAMLRALHACGIDMTFALAGPSEMFDVASEFFKSEWFNTWLAAHDAEVLAQQAERIRELEAEADNAIPLYEKDIARFVAERDAARTEAATAEAVIEKVQAWKRNPRDVDEMLEVILTTAPTAALEAVKTQVVAETIREFEDLYFGPGVQTRTWVANTMRKRHGLPDRTVEEADK